MDAGTLNRSSLKHRLTRVWHLREAKLKTDWVNRSAKTEEGGFNSLA